MAEISLAEATARPAAKSGFALCASVLLLEVFLQKIALPGTGGLYPPLVPIARVVKLDDDGAVAVPLADPSTTSFAIVEPPFEPAAIAADAPASTDSP